jgi:hypothetical protein
MKRLPNVLGGVVDATHVGKRDLWNLTKDATDRRFIEPKLAKIVNSEKRAVASE